MKKLRLLSVSFDTHIKPWELKKFRGAVARKVGIEHEWFHNHDNSSQFDSGQLAVSDEQSDQLLADDQTNVAPSEAEAGLPTANLKLPTKKYHHRYPLIQYKIDTHGEQMRPMLLCLDDCIEEAHHFFSQSDWSLRIGDRVHDMRIARLHVDQINLNVWETHLPYRLHKWRALNSENFKQWQQLDGLVERIAFLENILAAHILSFARGVGWELDKRFEVKITKMLNEEWVSYKDIKVLAFTIEFKTNISMPDFIGLGQGSGEGFGVVRRQTVSPKLAVGSGQSGREQNENDR
jgi:hypothetical protein